MSNLQNPIDTRDVFVKYKQLVIDNTALQTAFNALQLQYDNLLGTNQSIVAVMITDTSAIGLDGYTKNGGADNLVDDPNWTDLLAQIASIPVA